MQKKFVCIIHFSFLHFWFCHFENRHDRFSACFALSKTVKKNIQVMKSVSTWSLHEKKRSISFHIHDRCYTFSISLKCLATLPSMFSSRGSCSVCCPETCHSLQIFFQIFHVLKKLPSRTKKIVILDFFKCKYITFL